MQKTPSFLEVNQGQDQNLGMWIIFRILFVKQDGTRSFIKVGLYKVYLLFKITFFICSPIFWDECWMYKRN